MLLDKNSIIIDELNMSEYLISATFGYNKLWSSDTGRNMARNTSWNFNTEYFLK